MTKMILLALCTLTIYVEHNYTYCTHNKPLFDNHYLHTISKRIYFFITDKFFQKPLTLISYNVVPTYFFTTLMRCHNWKFVVLFCSTSTISAINITYKKTAFMYFLTKILTGNASQKCLKNWIGHYRLSFWLLTTLLVSSSSSLKTKALEKE